MLALFGFCFFAIFFPVATPFKNRIPHRTHRETWTTKTTLMTVDHIILKLTEKTIQSAAPPGIQDPQSIIRGTHISSLRTVTSFPKVALTRSLSSHEAERQRYLEDKLMKWSILASVVFLVLEICFAILCIWLLANLGYYFVALCLPILEMPIAVLRSFQNIFGFVSSLLWHLVRWMGYVVGFAVFVALGIWSDMNRMV